MLYHTRNQMEKIWTKNYDQTFPQSFNYPDKTMFELFMDSAKENSSIDACIFLGTKITFKSLYSQVEIIADGLLNKGIRKGDVVTICLPNTPHAVIAFYAINKIGCIANMVHPLTPAEELSHIIAQTNSIALFVLDAFLHKYMSMLKKSQNSLTIVCSITDYLMPLKKLGFYVTKGRKIIKVVMDDTFIKWKDLSKLKAESTNKGYNSINNNSNTDNRNISTETDESFTSNTKSNFNSEYDNNRHSNSKSKYLRMISPEDCAVYLHSGGTMGLPKTIMLSSNNMNALAVQGPDIVGIKKPRGLKMATILPLFHGFGLCMGMHTMMVNGITSILVPQFSADSLVSLLKNEKPDFIAAVPTLLEGIMKNKGLENQDLSYLKAIFCGGDTLTGEQKVRFDNFLKERNCKFQVREGYGLTETVTVCCVNPIGKNTANTVGLPLADISMCITEIDTDDELPINSHGEICVSGPTVMLGYLNDPIATGDAIHKHKDGLLWVHTGDYGFIDEEGFVHFIQRMKRIIKVSGIPVFPSQIEDVIMGISGIKEVCAIGIPHPYKMQVVKVFVVLENMAADKMAIEEQIKDACLQKIIKHAVPAQIEFIDVLPRTKVGKIDTVKLCEN